MNQFSLIYLSCRLNQPPLWGGEILPTAPFNDGVGAVGGNAVVLEQGVQDRADHAALRGVWC